MASKAIETANFKLEDIGSELVVTVRNPIEFATEEITDELSILLPHILGSGTDLTFDLEGIERIDSWFLGAIYGIKKKLPEGVHMNPLRNASPDVVELIGITGMEAEFPLEE